MNISLHLSEKLRVMAANHLLTVICMVMAGTSIMNHIDLKKAQTYSRTVVTPMRITEPMSFQGNDADDGAFRQYAAHIVSLEFTYSPATARTNFNDLLTIYDPELYAKGQKELSALLEKIEVARVCSAFYPTSFKIDRKSQSIAVTGLRRVIADDGAMPINTQKTYLIQYRMEDGKFLLKGVDEQEAAATSPVQTFKPLNARK